MLGPNITLAPVATVTLLLPALLAAMPAAPAAAAAGRIQGTITNKLTGQPVYIVQEVALGSTNTRLQPASFENTGSLIGFDYADAIKTQFTGDLANFGGFAGWSLIPSAYSSAFVNNHDTERDGSNLSYKNGATYVLAT